MLLQLAELTNPHPTPDTRSTYVTMQRLFGAQSVRALRRGAFPSAAAYKPSRAAQCSLPNTRLHNHLSTQHYYSTQPTRIPTMSANIVLPQLDQWAKTGLTAMFQAATESAFDEAFDNFIAAKPASIVVNGKTLTREQYKDMIFKAKPFRETGAQVDFGGAVAVEKVEGDVRVCISFITFLYNAYIYNYIGRRGWPVCQRDHRRGHHLLRCSRDQECFALAQPCVSLSPLTQQIKAGADIFCATGLSRTRR